VRHFTIKLISRSACLAKTNETILILMPDLADRIGLAGGLTWQLQRGFASRKRTIDKHVMQREQTRAALSEHRAGLGVGRSSRCSSMYTVW
jgi:hypothetical protein